MQLDKSEISIIETSIHKSNIPYEDVKVELVDHMATIAEMKIEENINLSFDQAFAIASIPIKESILNIRDTIRKNTIKEMLKSSIEINIISIGIVMFFSSIVFAIIAHTGMWNLTVARTFLPVTALALIVLFVRTSKLETGSNYRLKIMKDYAYIPFMVYGGFAFILALIFHRIYIHNLFHNTLFQYFGILPICLCTGIYLKVLLDISLFNVKKLKEAIEVHEIFQTSHWEQELT